jgi:LAO/AO transport system kinase
LGTREAIIAVEAAGYDVVIVETIGVGQSEILVRSLVDVCVLVSLTGGGDELQAIKRGILELADIIAVNKADGDNKEAAQSEALAIRQARSVVSSYSPGWNVPVLPTSATEGVGVGALCDALIQCVEHLKLTGQLERLRLSQNIEWFDERVTQALKVKWLGEAGRADAYRALRDSVLSGSKSPPEAVFGVLEILEK